MIKNKDKNVHRFEVRGENKIFGEKKIKDVFLNYNTKQHLTRKKPAKAY